MATDARGELFRRHEHWPGSAQRKSKLETNSLCGRKSAPLSKLNSLPWRGEKLSPTIRHEHSDLIVGAVRCVGHHTAYDMTLNEQQFVTSLVIDRQSRGAHLNEKPLRGRGLHPLT